jgi:hypothetical protein
MRYPNHYDADLAHLQDTVQRIVVELLVPSAASGAASVKRALLADLGTIRAGGGGRVCRMMMMMMMMEGSLS